MYAISCDGCGTTAYAGCACPEGHDPAQLGQHHDTCQLSSIDALVTCPPGSDCCQDDHDHAPDDCHAEHGRCPAPASCKLWRNVRSHHEDPDAAGLPAECPGGHHGFGVPGCTPCRALTITFIPSEPMKLQRAAG
jgi:hypothetical protein